MCLQAMNASSKINLEFSQVAVVAAKTCYQQQQEESQSLSHTPRKDSFLSYRLPQKFLPRKRERGREN